TQDADSEGEEGKFFVWSAQEVEQVLGKDDADFFGSVFDVTPGGNWEGVNILHRARSDQQDAALLKIAPEELRERIERCKAKLVQVRSARVWPGRDEKILTAWNGLMIGAFALASQILDNAEYREAARKAADYVLTRLRTTQGRLLRTSFAGM